VLYSTPVALSCGGLSEYHRSFHLGIVPPHVISRLVYAPRTSGPAPYYYTLCAIFKHNTSFPRYSLPPELPALPQSQIYAEDAEPTLIELLLFFLQWLFNFLHDLRFHSPHDGLELHIEQFTRYRSNMYYLRI